MATTHAPDREAEELARQLEQLEREHRALGIDARAPVYDELAEPNSSLREEVNASAQRACDDLASRYELPAAEIDAAKKKVAAAIALRRRLEEHLAQSRARQTSDALAVEEVWRRQVTIVDTLIARLRDLLVRQRPA